FERRIHLREEVGRHVLPLRAGEFIPTVSGHELTEPLLTPSDMVADLRRHLELTDLAEQAERSSEIARLLELDRSLELRARGSELGCFVGARGTHHPRRGSELSD